MASGMAGEFRLSCVLLFVYICSCVVVVSKADVKPKSNLLVFTIATEETDGFRRFQRSVKKYGYNVKVVGMGEKWDGGDILRFAGGGHKVNMLKKEITQFKDDKDLIIMFVDSYDVVFTGTPQDVIKSFKKFSAKVVFSAEGFCWPDPNLYEKYPQVKFNEKRYLNSGGFIGYAPDLYQIITNTNIGNHDDDQLYYTNIYLDEKLRKKWSIKLDNRGEIFQNLNGALDDVQVKFKGSQSYLYNTRTGNTPIVVHGNGPIKHELNRLTDYLADQWTPSGGCAFCSENTISLKDLKEEDFPQVMVSIFLEYPIPFAAEFLQKVAALKYPKKKIDVFIHYADAYHTSYVEQFLKENKDKYNTVTVHNLAEKLNQWTARNKALEHCISIGCQYFLSLDGEAHLDNADSLQFLIEQNRTVISPMLVRVGKVWSNFWGSLSKDGYYKRSNDYLDIVQNKKLGLWNIPYMSAAYLIHGSIIPKLLGGFIQEELDPDMAICKTMREKGIFMYISNSQNYGHLINNDNFNSSVTHPDMYQIFDNPHDWEKKYIHPKYRSQLDPYVEIEQPCNDVFWIPVVTETYCKDLIEITNVNGGWSDGTNNDPRLSGGYENVPTVDIHMNQVGLERHWLHFLKEYVAPIATKNYPGYYSDARAVMNFLVRYRPTEQPFLRPHHDSSTFSINIALNRPHIDFEGGGTHFIRQKCRVLESRVGWMLMHPGRLTHYHEGLPVTNGTRYIMVSFVDP